MSRNRRVSTAPSIVTARNPGDLVAAIPYLVGFTPTRSLVVASLRGARLRLGLVARADLPDEDVVPEAARSLTDYLMRDRPREAVVLVYDERRWDPSLRPWQQLVEAMGTELASHGVSVREAIYVTPQRFWSFTCTSNTCCPDDGWPLTETAASAVAATYVLHGRSPFADRQSLAARLAPKGPVTTAAVGYATEAALGAIAPWWQAAGEPVWTAWQRNNMALFDTVVNRYLQGGPDVSPDEAGRLLAGLIDVGVRDVVACRWTQWWQSLPHAPANGPDQLETQAAVMSTGLTSPPDTSDPDVHQGVERLLVDLAVRSDEASSSAPLTLLAMHAWAVGEGAQAGVAIERALTSDPTYSLALLVDALMRSGLEPTWVGGKRAKDEAARPRRRSRC